MGSDSATTMRSCLWDLDQAGPPFQCPQPTLTDRGRLALARSILSRHGVVTSAERDGAPESIVADLVNALRDLFPDAEGACVFWTPADQAACLNPDGSLRSALPVHVHGFRVADAATAAFGRAGLRVVPGPAADILLVEPPKRSTLL